MPYQKFLEIQQYFLDEPFGARYETFRDGVIASIIYNSNISNKADAKAPYDFFDCLPKPELNAIQDPKYILEQMARFGNKAAAKELEQWQE